MKFFVHYLNVSYYGNKLHIHQACPNFDQPLVLCMVFAFDEGERFLIVT